MPQCVRFIPVGTQGLLRYWTVLMNHSITIVRGLEEEKQSRTEQNKCLGFGGAVWAGLRRDM